MLTWVTKKETWQSCRWPSAYRGQELLLLQQQQALLRQQLLVVVVVLLLLLLVKRGVQGQLNTWP
jgi:hypothetical protein